MKITESQLRRIVAEELLKEIKTVKDMGGPAIKFDIESIDVNVNQFKNSINDILQNWGYEKASKIVSNKNRLYIFFDASVRYSELKMSVLDNILDKYNIAPSNYNISAQLT